MNSLKRILTLAVVLILSNTAASFAAENGEKNQLVILSTSVDRAHETATIHGAEFGSQAPAVWCESYPMTVVSSTDTDVVVYLPGAVKDGTYLLTVVRNGAKNSNGMGQFNLNVTTLKEGARGAKGDAGPIGAKGDTGAAGPQGVAGA